jgi:hypothetical protein
MSEEKMSKAISICTKDIAKAEEIIYGCGGVFPISIKEKNKWVKGLLSCSVRQEGHALAMCVWREREDKFEKILHFDLDLPSLITLQSHIQLAKHAYKVA